MLGVRGTGFESANHWLVGIILEAGRLGVDIMQMDHALPLDWWSMAIVGGNGSGAIPLGAVARGRK